MSVTTTRYGVHWAQDTAYLHQARGDTNALGLRQKSPFTVRTARNIPCNHMIQLAALTPARSHLDKLQELVSRSELVRFMLPVPKDDQLEPGVLFTSDPDADLLQVAFLARMSGPVRLPVCWANTVSIQTLVAELNATDVQPLILAGVTPDRLGLARDAMRESRNAPRRLLVMARKDTPLAGGLDASWLFEQDEVELGLLPFESLGATVLRAYMRREYDGGFLRQLTPGNETKVPHG